MRTNEYYSKKYITLVISSTVIIYSIATLASFINFKDNSIDKSLEFIPNFDKNYKLVVALTDTTKFKNINNSNDKIKYSLSSISYDTSTLYLDWSSIEAERSKIEAEIEREESDRKAQEYQDIQTVKSKIKPVNVVGAMPVSSTIKNVINSLPLPDILDTSFKGYMSLYKITSTSSKQWAFLRSGEYELTANPDGIMMYKDYYIVAMASYYTNYKVGSTFRITLDSGVIFNVITGDEKADKDTDSNRMYRPKGQDRGEIIEFIVAYGDSKIYSDGYTFMSDRDRRLGDLSSLGFQGNVAKIEKLDDTSVSDELY